MSENSKSKRYIQEYQDSIRKYIEDKIFWEQYWDQKTEKAYSIMSQNFDYYMEKYNNWVIKLGKRKDWSDRRLGSLLFQMAIRYGETIYENYFARYILYDWYFSEPYGTYNKLSEDDWLNIIEQDILENMVKLKVAK